MAIGDAPIKVNQATAHILNLLAMVTPGVYPKRVPFGGCASRSFRTDSPTTFPITMTVTEAD
jgi:hypothetical protein